MILTINPGATSTKVALFQNRECVNERNISHSAEELSAFKSIAEQADFRRHIIEQFLTENGVELAQLKAIACRGGASRPVTGGVYLVDEHYLQDIKSSPYQHPANLASIIGTDIAATANINAYIVDSEMSDEMLDIARFSGHKAITRQSRGHFLNQKAVARLYAESIGKPYEQLKLIVCHMGGGNSVGAHCNGHIIDMTDAISEGGFSTDRSGSLPTRALIDQVFSGQRDEKQVKLMLQGQGGLMSYLSTLDMEQALAQAATDNYAARVIDAFCYQIAKDIGAMATTLNCCVDGIILTGGIAHSARIVDCIKQRVSAIAAVVVFAGDRESLALANGVQHVLDGNVIVKRYPTNH